MNTIRIEYPTNIPDYALIDSGSGEKLEIISSVTLSRPDPRAIWQKSQKDTVWNLADARYVRTSSESGTWNIRKNPPKMWCFHYSNCTFSLKPTDFKHIGIFPEQAVNWDWVRNLIHDKRPSILNLFAYTGGATVVAAKNGAHVTHVDSVKSTISWANENCKLSAVPYDNVRWIEDDAYKFVLREEKRGMKYDGLILDPPRFGRGPKGEIWKLEVDLPRLLCACKQILSSRPLFILLNAYTADLSSLVLHHLMKDMMKDMKGNITSGELATQEETSGRLLPQGIFARWQQ